MGKRDYRRRETKKPKKDGKKVSLDTVLLTPVTVEVVKKKHKKRESSEESEEEEE